jgi:hypothetical protein
VSARAVKRCPRCRQVKPAVQFYRQHSQRLSPCCRSCQQAAARESRNRRRQDPTAVEQLWAIDRARQRRGRALGGQLPDSGDAA